MGSIGVSAVRHLDGSGDPLDDDAGNLNVNIARGGSIDIGDVEILGHDALISGAVNLTDSAVQLSSLPCKHIDIMANLSNTGIVYIGSSGVDATTGIALYPGDVYSVDLKNLNILYAMSTVSGDDINVQILT